MRAPEISYRYLRDIDTAGPTFEMVSRELSGAATSVTVAVTLMGIPKNKILVLANVTALAQPGATQACTHIQLAGFTAAGQRLLIMQERFVVAADVEQTLNWSGEVWLPGRGPDAITVEIEAVFDAGVASNTNFSGLYGIISPRGNASAF